MSSPQAIELVRRALETAFWLAAPLLLVTMVVSLLINIVQVLTSLQETTLSVVPKLAAVAGASFILMPWMVRKLTIFTLQLFSDFRPYLQ